MKLYVKANIPIPHPISFYDRALGKQVTIDFNPGADVPDERAKALLETHPHMFTGTAPTAAELKKYTVKQSYKKQLLADVLSGLSEEDQLKVFEFAKELRAADAKSVEKAKADAEKKAAADAKAAEKTAKTGDQAE